MNMTPRFQKLTLLAHITFSVGWFGAILSYLALAIAGLISRDSQTVRAVCLAMELIGWYVIVPFSLAALFSGLLQSLGTQWGLFRHWWILAKLLLTIFAVAVLLEHMQDVGRLARMAQTTGISAARLRPELIHSGGGLLVLLAAMTLSVFKPWGKTAYGRRQAAQTVLPLRADKKVAPSPEPIFAHGAPRWQRVAGIHVAHAAVIVPLFVLILHVAGHHHH